MNIATNLLRKFLGFAAVALLCMGCSNGYLASTDFNPWQVVTVPTESNLLDIAFVNDKSPHGWVVGANATLFETTDNGETWEERTLDLDQPYRFTSVSFRDREGWIVGQPSILLHTEDEGRSWSRIPLSEKLPGAPNTIEALGPQSAEMTTNIGAIYQTSDGGKTWKAMVEEAVGVVRNISRSSNGEYVAVSARGNFYSTWKPGLSAWEPHNRNSSRRVQNMGFTKDGRLWMLARGGQVQFSSPENLEEWSDAISPEFSTSWGLLDLAYRTPDEVWVTGGSGNLLLSQDGGNTWQKDRFVEDVPSNLYRIKFFGTEKGFIIGQQGTLLKYVSGVS
ncbi:MAG: photosynthesis system II assembly factor Ycf48 [Oscillatoriales cyanobacterium C42_A2020_001]|nr:photosynthesis system II assembly factor Ycf48 [Leptolyngbyaceae cyanobacterium C42_A2020_001]